MKRAESLLAEYEKKTLGQDVTRLRRNGTHERVGRMQVTALRDVPIRAVEWLWRGKLPLGKVVVLDGPPGQGKSTCALDIAARGSRGYAMPDGSRETMEPWESLFITYEDDAGDTLRPRLEAAGGDAERVHHVEGIAYNGSDDLLPPSLPKDIELLGETLRDKHPDVRLVVIDPLMAAISADIDSHRDQDVRRVLARLAKIAQECHVCIVVIRHLRKSHGGNALTAGGGSIGIIGQARVGLLVDRHPEIEDASVLAVVKSNLATIGPSLAFRKATATVTDAVGDLVETSKLDWIGEISMSADELLQAREDAPGDTRDAREWLTQILGAGKVERGVLVKAGADAGFKERTLDWTARKLNVVKRREGFGRDMRSFWALPDTISSATSASSAYSGTVAELGNLAELGAPFPPKLPNCANSRLDGNVAEMGQVAEMGEEIL